MSEMVHYVDPKLDIRFGQYDVSEFDGTAMQEHDAFRVLQDPNAGLFPAGHVHSMDLLESEGSDMD